MMQGPQMKETGPSIQWGPNALRVFGAHLWAGRKSVGMLCVQSVVYTHVTELRCGRLVRVAFWCIASTLISSSGQSCARRTGDRGRRARSKDAAAQRAESREQRRSGAKSVRGPPGAGGSGAGSGVAAGLGGGGWAAASLAAAMAHGAASVVSCTHTVGPETVQKRFRHDRSSSSSTSTTTTTKSTPRHSSRQQQAACSVCHAVCAPHDHMTTCPHVFEAPSALQCWPESAPAACAAAAPSSSGPWTSPAHTI